MLLPLVIFFFIDAHFLFFWFRERNINTTFEVRQFFCSGNLNVAFLENWTTMEKACPWHFEIYDKEKLRASRKLPLTALSARYLNFFCYCTKRLMGFLYLLILSPCFVSLCPSFCDFEDFFNVFFSSIL